MERELPAKRENGDEDGRIHAMLSGRSAKALGTAPAFLNVKLSASFKALKSPALQLATNLGLRAPGMWPRPAEQSLPGERRDRSC